MNNSTLIFETLEASTNFTTHSSGFMMALGMFAFFTFLIFNTPTHIYILWLIVKGSGRVMSEFTTLNFSVCEIGNGVNGLFGLLSIFYPSLILPTHFLQGLGITGRPLFECMICVERYLAVVYPVTFLKYKPLRYRLICCAMSWITILGSCFFCFFVLTRFKMEAYIWCFTSQFIIFLSVQLFCLVAVLRALKQSGPGDRRKEENFMKRKAFKLILIATINIIVQYLPFTITGFIVIVTNDDFFRIWYPGFLCYVISSFVPPALYLQRAGKLSCLFSTLQVCAK